MSFITSWRKPRTTRSPVWPSRPSRLTIWSPNSSVSAPRAWNGCSPQSLRSNRPTTECLQGSAMPTYPLIRRFNHDQRRLIARTCPEHQTERHGIRQHRLLCAGDLEIFLLVGAQHVVRLVDNLVIARRHIDFRST